MIENITHILFENAATFPGKTAILHKDRKITYGELADSVKNYAQYFLEKGLRKGDNVLIFVPMSIELYKILCAVFHIGAVAVFVDAWADKTRLNQALTVVPCKAFIGCPKAFLLKLLSRKIREVKLNFVAGWGAFKPRGVAQIHQTANRTDTALITFTTGSTGIPKAAKRTHEFLLEQHDVLKRHLQNKPDDVDLATLPIFVLHNLACGTTSVIPGFNPQKPADIDPKKIAREIEKHNVNTAVGSPRFFEKLAEHGRVPTLRRIFTGGAPVFPRLAKKLQDAFPSAQVEIIFGSTEAEPISSITTQALLAHKGDMNDGLLVGTPRDIHLKIIQYVDAPVADFESLWLPDGEVGEICVEGKHVLKEYYNSDEAQAFAKINHQGQIWHRTGDAGYLDAHGRLFLMGRAKNKFEHGGKDFYVFPIENALLEIDGIEIGTVMKINAETCLLIELKPGTSRQRVEPRLAAIPCGRVIFLKKIPRDPRHHSKIDYGKLQSFAQSLSQSP